MSTEHYLQKALRNEALREKALREKALREKALMLNCHVDVVHQRHMVCTCAMHPSMQCSCHPDAYKRRVVSSVRVHEEWRGDKCRCDKCVASYHLREAQKAIDRATSGSRLSMFDLRHIKIDQTARW
jgi:hypothetical protein